MSQSQPSHSPHSGGRPNLQEPAQVKAQDAGAVRPAAESKEWVWERWFWDLLEISWSDVWKVVSRWEHGLRPESVALARIWFAAWIVTGFSGVVLLVSLLVTPPSPTIKSSRNSKIRRNSPVTQKAPAAANQEADLSPVFPANSSDSDAGKIRHADFETQVPAARQSDQTTSTTDLNPGFAAPTNPTTAPPTP